MKKRLISLLLAVIMVCSMIPTAFATTDEATQAAQALYELGLFKGTGTNADGTPIFDLDKTPTRNQAIIMLVRLLGKEEEALAGTWDIPFTDVTDAMKPYIGYAYANGLTNGYTATTYNGTAPIKANQYVTFVLRALGYESGNDFEVTSPWELSDKIGLTSGKYTTTTAFTRGNVALISKNALPITQKGTVISLEDKIEKEKNGEAFGWYQVNDQGKLFIRTNLDASGWDGYFAVVRHYFADGSMTWDTQSDMGSIVSYDTSTVISYFDAGSEIIKSQLFIFEDRSTRAEYSELKRKYDYGKALEMLSDKLAAEIDLDTRIQIKNTPETFELESFAITYDEFGQTETYAAVISEEIKQVGDYSLVYKGKVGTRKASLSYIGRGNGKLTFTRERGHFADTGASGTFYIGYCNFVVTGENNITCLKYKSNGIDYSF